MNRNISSEMHVIKQMRQRVRLHYTPINYSYAQTFPGKPSTKVPPQKSNRLCSAEWGSRTQHSPQQQSSPVMGEQRKETFELMAKFNHSRRAKVAVARNSAAAAQIMNVSAATAVAAAGGGSEQRGWAAGGRFCGCFCCCWCNLLQHLIFCRSTTLGSLSGLT